MSRRRYDWEVPLLCTPGAIESEESELLRLFSLPHSNSEHRELVRRWQEMLDAKEQIEEMMMLAKPPLEPTTTTTTATINFCRACLSVGCEGHRR